MESLLNLIDYINDNNFIKIKEIISQDINSINIRDQNQNTPLHYAVNLQNLEIVKLILEKGKYLVNAANKVGNTPLMIAAANGNSDIVSMLLDNYATINQSNFYSKTCIHFAASNNDLKIIELLVENGADILALDKVGSNILHYIIPIALNDQNWHLTIELLKDKNIIELLQYTNHAKLAPIDIIMANEGGQEILNFLLGNIKTEIVDNYDY